jgi:glycosidase
MKYFIAGIFLMFSFILQSQVTTDPEFPVPSLPLTVTLNTVGTNLEGYSGDIFAHTGVTIDGTQWQNVIGDWGNNSNQPQLTEIGTDLYELEITPSINDFYGVSTGDIVTELCFVFRSSDGSMQTSPDIFINVFSETDLRFVSPDTSFIYSPGDVQINAVALFATEMTLFVNESEIVTQSGNELDFTYSATVPGINTITISATDGETTVEEDSYFFLRSNNVIEDLPSEDLLDGINYIDDNTVTLVLYAPFKEFAYVKGSFNDWEMSLDNQMKQTTDGEKYWITLNGLTAGQEYAYQYIVDGEITIADPYTDKILDPWNDQYIDDETYPDLMEYPSNYATGIVSVFQTAQPDYDWVITDFSKPDNEDLIIYELLIRDFVEGHDYQSLIDTIGYLKNLGINAVELMPVNEFEGNSSWGYNPSFYFAPDKYYGTKNKLKEFIDVCHQNGIAVIMDMVLNHSYGQSPLLQLYAEGYQPTSENPWYNEDCPHEPWCWGSDFNHESQDTKDFIDRVNTYWLTEYKIDGYRFDYTKGFTNNGNTGYDDDRIAILKRMADVIWSVDPEAYIILEHWCDNSEEMNLSDYGMMLWGNTSHEYQEASMGHPGSWDFSWASYQERGWNDPHLVTYMESHDEERLNHKNITWGNSSGEYDVQDLETALKRVELTAAFFFSIPGPKMLWKFGELGYDYSIFYDMETGETDYGNDGVKLSPKPITWEYYDEPKRNSLYHYHRIFAELKNDHEAFSTDNFDLSVSGYLKEINLFHESMDVVVYGNFDVEERTGSPNLSSSSEWYDYYTQEQYDNSAEFTLAPGEYKILTSVMLELPDLPTDIDMFEQNQISVYPSLVADYITVKDIKQNDQIIIYDMNGKTIQHFKSFGQSKFNVSSLSSGLYIIKQLSEEEIRTGKFVKQ